MEDLGLTKLNLKEKRDIFFGSNIVREGPRDGGTENPE